ncbi:MAG: NADH-quinone oxidoreductase subunit NuoF [Chloroflexota bacterium]
MLSDSLRQELQGWIDLYPEGKQKSAVLPCLYAIQREYGYAPVEAQNELAAILGVEPAEVGAVVGYYHMIHEEAKGDFLLQVCTNVPCMLRGGSVLMHKLEEKLGLHHGETTPDGQMTLEHMECLGSCGTAPMIAVTEKATGQIRYFEEIETDAHIDQFLNLLKSGNAFSVLERWTPAADPENTGRAAGTYRVEGMDEPALTARVKKVDSHKIETYEADGGYAAARRVLTEMEPSQVIDEVKASGLRGRGGAGFPTGVKWSFLPPESKLRYLVVNADESEPGTFKDRIIMEYDPHQLIEGIIMSAHAVQTERAFVYIRGEYYFGYTRLVEAVAEAETKGYLGENIFGIQGKNLKLVIHRGAGAYECGEETALLTSLEGNRGHPRLKPPFPANEGGGLYSRPTIVNNVESVANVTHIMKNGVDWYKAMGTEQSTGMRIFCLSGNVKKPGLYELPHGVTLRELIFDYAGGLHDENAPIKAVNPGGISMKLLTEDQLDTPLSYEDVQAAGSLLGSAGIFVIDERASMVEVARRTVSFYREESCGKCTPCREGSTWLEKILIRIEEGGGRKKDLEVMEYISKFIERKSFCPFGDASVWGLQSSLQKFRGDWIELIENTNPDETGPEIPIRPIYRPDEGQGSGLTDTVFTQVGESPLIRDNVPAD